ncbi:unnamed protein product, partial [Hapterophycus canaliculatus]
PRYRQIFIKAFPRGSDGRRGILESTGLVELNDCLTAINGVALPKPSGLREVMASIRAAESPLSLRFARYPPAPLLRKSSSTSPSVFSSSYPSSLASAAGAGILGPPSPGTGSLSSGSGGGGGGLGSPDATLGGTARSAGAARVDGERRELAAAADPDLDGVLNSALVLGLGERVADIQKRNTRLVQEMDRIGRAASGKRQGVERVASAAASLTAAGESLLPQALRLLSTARQDAVALCEAMARLDELLAARERAQLARRRSFEEEVGGRGWGSLGGGGGGGFDYAGRR